MSKVTAIARLVEKIDTTSSDKGCWLYLGAQAPNGYGIFADENQKSVLAHRYAYSVFNGPIPDGKILMHKCNVKHCCSPFHVVAGTQKMNIAQCIREGRRPKTYAKRRPITESELTEIRTRHAAGESAYKIAKSLNRTETALSQILTGKTHTKPRLPKPTAPVAPVGPMFYALGDLKESFAGIITQVNSARNWQVGA